MLRRPQNQQPSLRLLGGIIPYTAIAVYPVKPTLSCTCRQANGLDSTAIAIFSLLRLGGKVVISKLGKIRRFKRWFFYFDIVVEFRKVGGLKRKNKGVEQE